MGISKQLPALPVSLDRLSSLQAIRQFTGHEGRRKRGGTKEETFVVWQDAPNYILGASEKGSFSC